MAEGWLCVSTLKQTLKLLVEAHDAGVVLEDADAPVVRPEPPADLLRRAEDRLLEQVVDAPAVEVDRALERLVRAVLRPGLGERLQLDVGRVAAQRAEVRLDRLHLGEVERRAGRRGSASPGRRRPARAAAR